MFNPNAKSYECPYCGSEELFYDKEIKDVDENGIDTIFEAVICKQCNARFDSKYTFSGHIERIEP